MTVYAMNSEVMDLMRCFINQLKMAVCAWLQSVWMGTHVLFLMLFSYLVYKSNILKNPFQELAKVGSNFKDCFKANV